MAPVRPAAEVKAAEGGGGNACLCGSLEEWEVGQCGDELPSDKDGLSRSCGRLKFALGRYCAKHDEEAADVPVGGLDNWNAHAVDRG